MTSDFDLDTPLLRFSEDPADQAWTIRNACEGISINGSMGSGKSSAVCYHLARIFLSHGFGGIFLTAKPDDAERYVKICSEAGRSNDVIVVEPGSPYHFNVIDFEARNQDGGKSYTQNLVEVLTTIVEASNSKNDGQKDDAFWAMSLKQAITQVIELSLLAFGRVTAQSMYDIIVTAPKSEENPTASSHEKTAFQLAFEAARDNVREQMQAWRKTWSVKDSIRRKNPAVHEAEMMAALPDVRKLKFLDQYFNETYRVLAPNTRSIIDLTFSTFLMALLQEPMFSMFCQHESNYTPEDTLRGKVIILNLPVKIFNEAGRDIQTMFKYLFQRAIERRNIEENARPTFLMADEAQFFVHPKDAECQSTARSSRLCTVYATQNLPNYYSAMSGDHSQYKVKSFLATLNTKFFCANNCMETNRFGSELIGQAYLEEGSGSTTMAGSFSITRNTGYRLEHVVRPEHFQLLKTGGPLNQNLVECFMHSQGFRFPDGLTFRKIAFSQH